MSKYTKVSEADAYESYDECLDSYGEVTIGYLTFLPSQIVKECDPIAYRVGFYDYCDSQEWEVEYTTND